MATQFSICLVMSVLDERRRPAFSMRMLKPKSGLEDALMQSLSHASLSTCALSSLSKITAHSTNIRASPRVANMSGRRDDPGIAGCTCTQKLSLRKSV
ncbi:Uncharacterised protein [Mycobacteroides abscessus subsp. abscessus]|nr:Uncharacterised protein [Mycobacteroides abscessus subsp. abscessus]